MTVNCLQNTTSTIAQQVPTQTSSTTPTTTTSQTQSTAPISIPTSTFSETGTLASDDFETGNLSGGQGWTSLWTGNNIAVNTAGAHGGSYGLQVHVWAERTMVFSQSIARIQFWANLSNMNTADIAELSLNGTMLKTWTYADSDGAYHYFDIDISPILPTSGSMNGTFEFEINGSGTLSIDDIKVVTGKVVSTMPTGLLAFDNFETGNLIGGQGWTSLWTGNNVTVNTAAAHGGNYGLQIGVWAERTMVFSQSFARIQFWAKLSNMNTADTAEVSLNSTALKTWTSAASDGLYHYYDIDISPILPTSGSMNGTFEFEINGSGTISIDDIEVVNGTAPAPLPAGELSWDNFETGNLIGGLGWTSLWTGNNIAVTTTSAHGGSYGLQIGVWAERSLVFSQSTARLQFWAKLSGMNTADTAEVSLNSTKLKTWTYADSDGTYKYYDIDLSSIMPTHGSMNGTFEFQITGNGTLSIDDIQVVTNGK